MKTLHQTQEQIALELDLIRKAQNNPKYFAPVYDKYYKAIFLFIYRRTDDEDLTADLTSQVFMKALVNLAKYQFKGLPFSSWLYRIAANEVNMHFRKHQSSRAISIEDEGLARLLSELHENPMEHTEAMDVEELITESLGSLEEEDLQFLELRFFEGRSFKEVAYITGITENNAKVKTYRILDKIKKFLKSKGKI
ncbi:MAG TPA: sigma-70 family RNA polymerase sigma factor [Cytophagaceae bacterium]